MHKTYIHTSLVFHFDRSVACFHGRGIIRNRISSTVSSLRLAWLTGFTRRKDFDTCFPLGVKPLLRTQPVIILRPKVGPTWNLKRNICFHQHIINFTTNEMYEAYLTHAILNDGIDLRFIHFGYLMFGTKWAQVSFGEASSYLQKTLLE